ncbi:hypothetical protein LO772_19355 [Yinghuangia sp. ASG 101]|uniref:hypothetical protein n=1 Tax=Yinghuangia sp. ASG 101 TaxID=2896848 RepID=UPI001E643D0E|nr:hypothetical protein [Yinghuangia sp. ASG 101]UGQ09116.1 hypothetical protein LO772_19355 [Yinghuangia sp. ASG 101]
MALTGWDLRFAPGGWVRLVNLDDGRKAYLRVEPSKDENGLNRPVTRLAIMAGEDKPISVHAWRNVPIADVEYLLGGGWADRAPYSIVYEPARESPPRLDDLDAYFDVPHEPTVYAERIKEAVNERPKDVRNPGGKITNEFLGELANMYRWLVSSGSSAPAHEIADQTGAPVRTAQRWIGQARKRGFLPPGRPGRAG